MKKSIYLIIILLSLAGCGVPSLSQPANWLSYAPHHYSFPTDNAVGNKLKGLSGERHHL